MGPIQQAITEKLSAAFHVSAMTVTNDSESHRGHAGYSDGESHFSVDIVSDDFIGLSRVARQRKIYAALGDMMKSDIHALVIKAKTTAEASA